MNQKPLIHLKNISKTYSNNAISLTVLKDINLEIHRGEFVAIVGESGSGKSTLMHILGCLDRPTTGHYYYDGEELLGFDANQLAALRRESFGFVFQSYNLIPSLTALENVEVPAIYAAKPVQQRLEKAKELLKTLGLEKKYNNYPSELSGGQQQRVSIARALVNGGEIILADEPTGALDSKSGKEVMQLLVNLSKKGHTVVLITHSDEVAKQADRVIEIQDGVIIKDGKTKDCSEQKGSLPKQKGSKSDIFFELGEAVKASFKALKMNIFRTVLTLLGIIIGVVSVIVMLAIGDGAKQEVVDRISGFGTNLLLIRPGSPTVRGFQNLQTLVPGDMYAINELDNITASMPESRYNTTLRYKGMDTQTQINATNDRFVEIRNWDVKKGTFFDAIDVKNRDKVIVLGQSVAQELFKNSDPVGDYVMVNSIMFQVIGVMDEQGASSTGIDQDDIVFIPYTTASLHIFGYEHFRNITVAVEDISMVDQTQEHIRQLLLSRHGMEDFRIRNMASLIKDAIETQTTMTIMLGTIAAVSLLVGGIGVMNIMLVSVTERTKEIGIRMATGARKRNIMQQFLTESIILSAFGGLIGVVLGLGGVYLVSLFDIAVIYSVFPVVLAFCFAFLTGLIFGYLPAKKAAKLDPVVALASK